MLWNKRDAVVERLQGIAHNFAPATLASSFSAEDIVLTDLIDRNNLNIEIFTLDTGRLPEETYRLMQLVREKFHTPIRIYAPAHEAIEAYVANHGPNAFYDSVALRQSCCQTRKVEQLRRALSDKLG